MTSGRLPLTALVGDGQNRARVPHRKASVRDFRTHLLRKLQQTHVVGNRRAIFADRRSDLFLGHAEIAAEFFVGCGLIDRVQVFALNVFDERHLEELGVVAAVHFPDDDGHARQTARCAARQRRSPAMMRQPPSTLRTTMG